MKKVLSFAFVSALALTAFGIKTSTSQAATTVDSNHVSVVAGDTYKSIAAANGVSIPELEQANGREIGGFDLIFPGEIITLPTSTAVQQNVEQTQTQEQAPVQEEQVQAPVQEQAPVQQEQTQAAAQPAQTQQATTQSAGQSAGQFKISFYDPAVLGSNMGYGGVAANLSIFPKGTRLMITLADGTTMYRTVNDTGTFAYSNPYQLDVAMPNASIPSYGVTSATVTVVG
ncbi:LysM peptidoglycan-binding domain-containing protein [Companilactobacillus sp.]|jgi:LysM repeat protein|uniref:LysM peptidoglycan-binding domain-containing protein n=1 Tax=Companilactobacillus sp. TaxID=2767905 RepID=UPI0025C08EDB|nr:LysM peptidoglycan-binding domain-containing protein [Companilactobacillus sp.]MCH4008592.1 LysM peptidoglycan-binding domain-containing protein [Companilactobacillus sp.]MCH4051229.1 LysM peptidoglycan-binding domain-containing protein [Companilactobacillus sp.]MCH4076535.1 LysM peptidoglycan-binding domain-containing protein [Companilactobacillus sp.]MCH4125110.1 LysM peptidoglycan-binding domain-containing protein [Companilactobacillus sp.]MCH4131650.1 LysM peptidoglycan-binding domain-c